MSKETFPTASDVIAVELDRWRAWLVDGLLVAGLVSGLFALLPTALHAVDDLAERSAAIVYGVVYSFGLGLLLARRLDTRWRAAGFLAAAFAVSALDMARGGLAGSGRVYLMASIALTIALFGWRAGIAAGLSSLAVYAAFGAAVLQGRLMPLPVTGEWWVSEGTGFAMAVTLLLVTQVSFVTAHRRALERALQAEEQLTLNHLRQLQVARDLHDETVQQMYGVILVLRRAIADIQRYPEQSVARLTHALDLSMQAWQGLRDHLQALGQSAQAPKPSSPKPTVSSKMADLPGELAPFDIQMVLTRITQEALCNVYRHSRATQVHVEMRLEDECVRIGVQDNGAGFDPADADSRGFGLADLREQIAAQGGTLTVNSAPGAGTRLSATIPWGASSHEH
jgi:signal transduction histidine kinase